MVRESARLLFGPVTSDLHEGINVSRMREARASRVRDVLKKRGIPAMLVTGAANVRYLVGFWWGEFQPAASYCLFFAEQDPVVFAHAGSFQQMPDQAPWIEHWRIGRSWLGGIAGPEASLEEARLFATEIRRELEERKLAREPLAVVDFDALARDALAEQGLTITSGGMLLLEASQVKTVDEVNCLKMAASIGGAGFQAALEALKPGVTQNQITRILREAVLDAGAENPRGGVHSGPQAFERGISGGDRRIEYGDLGYVRACGTSYMGYTACLYRSFVVGRKPTSEERDWYKALKARIDAVIEEIRPGATTAEAAKHFPPASTWGYGDEAEVLSVEFGHGIGLVCLGSGQVHYNWPVINRQWSVKYPQVFEPGMVIAVESLEGRRRIGGVRLEDMVVVTERGAELLDFFPRDEILVAGARVA